MAPYVVSQDISTLLQLWGAECSFTVPPRAVQLFRDQVARVCRSLFERVEFIPEEELRSGLIGLVAMTGLPTVSLDTVYCPSRHHLSMTRYVTLAGEDAGVGPRYGHPELSVQVERVAAALRAEGQTEALLVDDVAFTGGLLVEIAERLLQAGVHVSTIVVGVAIGSGLMRVQNAGWPISAAYTYDEVVDEICERDFLPGVSHSGRTVSPLNGRDIGLPYLLPFGRPADWASIPEDQAVWFSRECLHAAAELYRSVEEASDRPVRLSQLSRLPGNLPAWSVEEDVSVVEVLCELVSATAV